MPPTRRRPRLERLCPRHYEDLPASARKLYKPPPKPNKLCHYCDANAKFFGENEEPPRCPKHTLAALDPAKPDKRSKTRKRDSCGGLKRNPSTRCGDGMCGADASKGVIEKDPVLLKKLRKCIGCGTEKVDKHKEAVDGYEFAKKKARVAAEARAAKHQ